MATRSAVPPPPPPPPARSSSSSAHLNRSAKKMRKRRELDALVAHTSASKRPRPSRTCNGHQGASSQDQLLSESTDERRSVVAGQRAAKGGRGGKGGRKGRGVCGPLLRACSAALVFACAVATVTVMWLFIDIREQVTQLRSRLDRVVAGSQGVTDALQKYHSLSKGLQQNQTVLFTNLELLKTQLTNFSAQVSPLQYSLHELQEKLKAAPALVNVPQNLEGLKSNVASFGSQIRDFNTTVAELKIQNKQLQDTSAILVKNLTTTELAVAYLQNVSKQLHANGEENDEHRSLLASINQLSQDVTRMNESLNGKFQWIEGDAEDQKRDHKNLEKLQELGQNVSARITTLEGECVKTSAQTAVLQQVQNITERVTYNEGQLHDLNNHLQLFQNNYTQLILTVNSLYETITHLTSSVLPTEPTKITETP